MVGQPENNCSKYVSGSDLIFLEIIYSTFGVALSAGGVAAAAAGATEAVAPSADFAADAAPVCVIGTTRSVSC